MTEVAKERIRRAGKEIKEEYPEADIDTGFKVFAEAKSNFVPFKKVKGQDDVAVDTLFSELEKQITPLAEGWKKENVLTEVILKSGFAIDCDIVKHEVFVKNEVYRIEDSAGANRKEIVLFVCFDEKIDADTIARLFLNDKEKFICLDSAIDDTSYARLADKGKIETL